MLRYSKYNGESLNKFFCYVDRLQRQIDRRLILDFFTPCQRPLLADIPKDLREDSIIQVHGDTAEIDVLRQWNTTFVSKKDHKETLPGELLDPTEEFQVYGVVPIPGINDGILLIQLNTNAQYTPFAMDEKFYLDNTMIENYSGSPIVTDVGKFFANKLILAIPFGDLIPYINEAFNLGSIDNKVASLILEGKINRTMYNTYMNNGYWYGFDGSIATAAWSEKSITTDPELPAKRKVLLEKYKDRLDDPTIAIAIETELIKLDKDYIKGDVSEPFYAVTSGKSFGEARKKMYGIFGLGVAFGRNKGEYDFTSHSLEDGWEPQDIAVVANDVRRGSYGRGIETAKGGEQTKLILRMFQEVKMEPGDCGTKRGLKVTLTERNKKQYIGRYLVSGPVLTDENINSYVGQTVTIRSPMYCQGKHYCSKCCGQFFEKLGVENIGMQALAVCSTFTGIAMKTMHASSLKTTHLVDIDRFFKVPEDSTFKPE